jgi:hypothetical protein
LPPPNKAMKLTSPERIEVSQLIAGVRRTSGRSTERTRPGITSHLPLPRSAGCARYSRFSVRYANQQFIGKNPQLMSFPGNSRPMGFRD